MNTKKIMLAIALSISLFVILFPIIYTSDNLGFSLESTSVKKGAEMIKLSSIINSGDQQYVVFYSFDCPACKNLLNNDFLTDKIIFINIDYNKNIPHDVYQLVPSEAFKIVYIPYIVQIDSNNRIIKEFKLYEIEEKIKNKEIL